MRDINSISRGKPWPKTGATQKHAQLGLPDKDRAIKRLVVCNNWGVEPLGLINCLVLGCYQPSPEVLTRKYEFDFY